MGCASEFPAIYSWNSSKQRYDPTPLGKRQTLHVFILPVVRMEILAVQRLEHECAIWRRCDVVQQVQDVPVLA